MKKYNKIQTLKIVIFWMLTFGIVCFIVDSILAISEVSYPAILALFIIGIILVVPAGIIWLTIWFSRINKKIVGENKKESQIPNSAPTSK